MNTSKTIFDTWDFGTDIQLAKKLKDLVLSGKKTATTGLFYPKKTLPKTLDFGAIKDSQGKVFCIVQYTSISVIPFLDIQMQFISKEAEGDTNQDSWRDSHRSFFVNEYGDFNENSLMVCTEFKVIETSVSEDTFTFQ